MTESEERYANMIAISPCLGIPKRGIEKGHMYVTPEGKWGTLSEIREKYGKNRISKNDKGPLCLDCKLLLSGKSKIELLK